MVRKSSEAFCPKYIAGKLQCRTCHVASTNNYSIILDGGGKKNRNNHFIKKKTAVNASNFSTWLAAGWVPSGKHILSPIK